MKEILKLSKFDSLSDVPLAICIHKVDLLEKKAAESMKVKIKGSITGMQRYRIFNEGKSESTKPPIRNQIRSARWLSGCYQKQRLCDVPSYYFLHATDISIFETALR